MDFQDPLLSRMDRRYRVELATEIREALQRGRSEDRIFRYLRSRSWWRELTDEAIRAAIAEIRKNDRT